MTIRLGNKIISGGGSSGVPGWTGTLAEYNNLTEIDDNMLYYITDDCLDETNSSYSASLELGDIGFTALGVNEELNLRRYLNGQVIAMDEFPEFTAKLKHAVSLNSEISVTEAMWQSEVTLSPNGICYKFVIDDDNMTIRLPKYPEYFIAGLSDSTGVAGNGMTLGLTDGVSNYGLQTAHNSTYKSLLPGTSNYGSNVSTSGAIWGNVIDGAILGVTPDSTKSGIEALVDSASEKIRGYYFIQVATGLEQNADITREITLNNPFFLGMYQYFEVEPNNISWLKSEGQWNSAEVYPGMWEWLLEKYNASVFNCYYYENTDATRAYIIKNETPAVGDKAYGYDPCRAVGEITAVNSSSITVYDNIMKDSVEVSLMTGTTAQLYENDGSIGVFEVDKLNISGSGFDSDYHFIIDHVTNTFRLPIKVKGAAGKAVVGNGMTLGLTDGTNNAGLWTTSQYSSLELYDSLYGEAVGSTSPSGKTISDKGTGVTTDPNYSGIETSTEGLHLYFYVGETVQDPTLINVGRITHALSLKTDMSQAASASMPSSKYVDLTLGASGTTYTAPANGYILLSGLFTSTSWGETTASLSANNITVHCSGTTGISGNCLLPVKKNDIVTVRYYNLNTSSATFRFIYAEGSQPTK